jgi:hypothetical protein
LLQGEGRLAQTLEFADQPVDRSRGVADEYGVYRSRLAAELAAVGGRKRISTVSSRDLPETTLDLGCHGSAAEFARRVAEHFE